MKLKFNKKALYESIMQTVSKELKKTLNEYTVNNDTRKHMKFGVNSSSEKVLTHDGSLKSFTDYLNDIRGLKMLEPEEEYNLAVIINTTDDANEKQKAIDALVKANLKAVISVANKYKGVLPTEELVQWGNIGLINAATAVNPEKLLFINNQGKEQKMHFSSYAIWYIRKSIMAAIDEHAFNGKMSFNEGLIHREIARIKEKFYNTNERYPSVEEIYAELTKKDRFKNVSIELIYEIMGESTEHNSLDATYDSENDNNDGTTVGDNIKSNTFELPGSSLDKADLESQLEQSLTKILGERNAYVLINHYGLSGRREMQIWEIAENLNLTPTMINTILRDSMAKLSKHPRIVRIMQEYMA